MRYIVDFFDNTARADIENYFAQNNATVISEYDKLGLVFCVETTGNLEQTSIVERLSLDTDISISPMVSYKEFPLEDTDEHWWKLTTVNIKDFTQTNVVHPLNHSKINVYILDSGIKADHQEFVGQDITNLYTYDGNFTDFHGHGTAIASLITGNRCSLATAKIKVVKLFGPEPTYQSHLLAALDAIITDHQQDNMAAVANLSWGIPKNAIVEARLQKLIDNNILVVCAAGNHGMPIADVTPAAMANAITVGSYNKELEPSNFSNYTGPTVISNNNDTTNYGAIDVWAPGEYILVANLNGDYGYAAGTSLSAAIESMALAYALGDYFTIAEIPPNRLLWQSLMPWFQSSACAKDGLLTLDGVYENSVNKVTNIHSQYSDPSTYQTRFLPYFSFPLETGKDLVNQLYNPRYTEITTTIPEVLPAGISIENGWIRANITLDENEPFRNIDIKIVHTSKDNLFTAEQTVKFLIYRADYNYQEEGMEEIADTLLQYQLYSCAGTTPVYTGGNRGYCFSQCPFFTITDGVCVDVFFYCGGIKTNQCLCQIVCP